jgi:predicted metal-binding membrane protein
VHSEPSVASVPLRDRYLISICLAVVTTLSWAYLVHLVRQPLFADDSAMTMLAMGMAVDHPWTSVDAAITFAMWAVMSVGMMTASAAPVLMLFAATQASRGGRRGLLPVLLFGLGYLSAWMGFSAIATFAQLALQRAALLSDALAASKPGLAAAILIVAGLYQLTPIKRACLTRCRTPLGFLMTHWHDGGAGAFRMGTEHGILCLGCCWALMIVLFAVGAVNLVWVAALTAIVLIEKVTRFGVILSRIAGIVMIASSIYLLM